jgi:hypothetical protein
MLFIFTMKIMKDLKIFVFTEEAHSLKPNFLTLALSITHNQSPYSEKLLCLFLHYLHVLHGNKIVTIQRIRKSTNGESFPLS